ncbi:MAG: hypothetical protein IM674_13555 [Brevundimonas sp.]|nr:hypothetical protein [Brevundimonas sp.]
MTAIMGWLGNRALAAMGVVAMIAAVLFGARKAGRDAAVREAQEQKLNAMEKANEARRAVDADADHAGQLLRDWSRRR